MTWLMWPWWAMISSEDWVTLEIEDTYDYDDRNPFSGTWKCQRCPFSGSKNGTSSARIQKGDHFFKLASPQNGGRHVFNVFTTSGWKINKFWILHIVASFLECKKGHSCSSIWLPSEENAWFLLLLQKWPLYMLVQNISRDKRQWELFSNLGTMRPFSNLDTPYFKNTDSFSFYHFY